MKLINKILKAPTEDISGILADLERIRQYSDLINCVFRATGSSWLGVNIAGKYMFPNATIEIPQFYSTQVLSDDQIDKISLHIAELGFNTFVFHGFMHYFVKFITSLRRANKKIRIFFVFHGFASEFANNDPLISSIPIFIDLVKQKKIDKMGVVKSGHEILFNKLFGIPVTLLYNKVPVYQQPSTTREKNNTHIGVLVNESFRKNLHVQVMAGLLIENAIIHVLDKSELYYLKADDRIVAHGMMPHLEYMALLASMDINLHITYSESFGGQVFTESLGYGVPCLTGYTNGFLDDDHELKSLLSVSEADDPLAIYNRIEKILPMRIALQDRLIAYSKRMNEKADKCLEDFLAE